MKLFTGLFRAARKRTMTTDNDMGMFRTKLEELVAGKDGPRLSLREMFKSEYYHTHYEEYDYSKYEKEDYT